MIEPLVVELTVAAGVEVAFRTWTERVSLWWPKGHTVSGDPAAIRFEDRAGGRIYEVAADGTEHDWGEVVEWDAPHRLSYLWHLFFDRSEATEVEVTFAEAEGGGTTVRLVQTGWERLGEPGVERRERTLGGWAAVTSGYRELVDT